MTYKTIYAEVDVDLNEFHDDDLIEELEERGYTVDSTAVADSSDDTTVQTLVGEIHQARRTNQSYDRLLDQLIWKVIGRIA